MSLFEIRSPDGARLASANDLSHSVEQLVAMIGRYRQGSIKHHDMVEAFLASEPDISATAPEHVAVFSAGWAAAQRDLRSVAYPWEADDQKETDNAP